MKIVSLILAALLSTQAGAECIPQMQDMESTTPQTIEEGVLASLAETRNALRRHAYLDCIKRDINFEDTAIELEKIDVEYTVEDAGYPGADASVAVN